MSKKTKLKTAASSLPAQTQYEQSLSEQVNTVQQEARMVLPGIQTLFGFQLVAVFNQGFKTSLTQGQQMFHLLALLLIAAAVILVIAPTAYHREANHHISKHFVELSSRFLAWSMIPFALGICIDIYLITQIITGSLLCDLVVTSFSFLAFFGVWFVYPKVKVGKIQNLPVTQLPESSGPLPR